MAKWILVVLLVIWICLILITGINIYRQYQLGKLQQRILDDYRRISEIESIFIAQQDSLLLDIEKANKLRKEMDKSFPLQDKVMNWLLLRISAVFMTIVTIVVYWLYYKRKAFEQTDSENTTE